MEKQENLELYTLRHSLAHVLAQAVQRLFPNVKLGFGPPIETGFYYDFDFGEKTLKEQDLKKIEKLMRKIISEKQDFTHQTINFNDAHNKINTIYLSLRGPERR